MVPRPTTPILEIAFKCATTVSGRLRIALRCRRRQVSPNDRLETVSYGAVELWLRTSTSSPYVPAARPVVAQLNVLEGLKSRTIVHRPLRSRTQKRYSG